MNRKRYEAAKAYVEEIDKLDRGTYLPRTLPAWLFIAAFGFLIIKYELFNQAMARTPMWPWWLFALWCIAFGIISSSTLGWNMKIFKRMTGRTYSEDRYAFAATGAYDIGRVLPLLVYSILFWLYYEFRDWGASSIGSYIINPWTFLVIGKPIADILNVVIYKKTLAYLWPHISARLQ
jgi:hypothetical protein